MRRQETAKDQMVAKDNYLVSKMSLRLISEIEKVLDSEELKQISQLITSVSKTKICSLFYL